MLGCYGDLFRIGDGRRAVALLRAVQSKARVVAALQDDLGQFGQVGAVLLVFSRLSTLSSLP